MNPLILYDNRLEDGTPTATDTDSDPQYNVLNLRDRLDFTKWKAASAGTKYITVDCGSAKTADCLAIKGHNLKTASATISVEYSSDNFVSDINVALAGFTPSDDKALMKMFTQASARYWRFKIVTASVVPEMAVLMIGDRLTFPHPPDTPYIPYKETIEAEAAQSEEGNHLGAVIKFHPIEIQAGFSYLDRSWVENSYLPFWNNHGKLLRHFFWAWDLENYPTVVFFIRMKGRASYGVPLSIATIADRLVLDMEGKMET